MKEYREDMVKQITNTALQIYQYCITTRNSARIYGKWNAKNEQICMI